MAPFIDIPYLHPMNSKSILKSIDLNCDMGELHPITGSNNDEAIMPYISSCNICCGFHSGSTQLSEKTVSLAHDNNVAIGAHPSYYDIENFGRITPAYNLASLKYELNYQITLIQKMASKVNAHFHHVKPHGALYNDLATDEALAEMFVDVIKNIDNKIKVYGLANSTFEKVCLKNDLNFISEVFADRRYESGAQLRSRKHQDAVIKKEIDVLNHIDQLLEGEIEDIHKNRYAVNAQTLCLHSDTDNAIALAQAIYSHLKTNGIDILPPE